MPLLNIINDIVRNKSYLPMDKKINSAMETFIAEVPIASTLNASDLRGMIQEMLSYRMSKDTLSDTQITPYMHHKRPSFSVPYIHRGTEHTLTIMASEANKDGSTSVVKVCPVCGLTANVGDPVCGECNYFYPNHDGIAHYIESSVKERIRVSKIVEVNASSSNKVILKDHEEGFTVTEDDVNRLLPNIRSFIPA